MTSEEAVARLVERLEAEGVPYMFTGALSANLYGVPRATNDADVVVAFEDFDVVAFVRGLGPDFILDHANEQTRAWASSSRILRGKQGKWSRS